MKHFFRVPLYLGFGLAVQLICYENLTFQTLFSADVDMVTWAHILAWPFFLTWLIVYYSVWVIALLLVACLVVVLSVAAHEAYERKRTRRSIKS